MTFQDLYFLSMFTGITLGQHCYLNISRVEEFVKKVNESVPNFFTSYNFKEIPNRIILESPNEKSQCTISSNNVTYTSRVHQCSDVFLKHSQIILEHFMLLFAIKSVRRIGKVYDFVFPIEEPSKQFLSRLIKIEEPVQVNNLQLLFHHKGKNINIHFIPIQDLHIQPDEENPVLDVPSGIVIRCDVNNSQTNPPLDDIPKAFAEIFGFIDEYVKSEMIDFLNNYLEGNHASS